MAMLAEPRRKQRWNLNPRGKHWSEDSSKFGQKMLEKMGWSSGKGLGANMDGMTEHIRLKYKNDQAGVGFSLDDQDKQWTEHQEGFNELLQKLHSGESAETTAAEKPAAENDLSGKSLELKSKQSRARVHYQKFTRGKDVNKYSAKDLANIFGKKDLDAKPKESEKPPEAKEQQPEDSLPEPVGSSDTSHGVVTIKGGSISDYFKSKMSALGRKVSAEPPTNDSESESETRVGFGFSSKKPSETLVNPPAPYFSFPNATSEVAASPKEPKITPRKRKNEFAFENPALDLASPGETTETPRKRKSDFAFDNPLALQLENGASETEHTPKRRKSEISIENCARDAATPTTPQNCAGISAPNDSAKRKRKKKVRECLPTATDGFVNEALNLESRDDETSSSGQFEVPRARFGLANDALDLTDETSGRKRVTFNETVEYDTDLAPGKRKKKKRSKNGGKLDKFEIDNEKMKRRVRKERQNEIVESAFVNEAMDVEVVSQEATENEANERKSERARRKRDRRMSNLETIAEAPDEEREGNVEVVTLDESLVGETSENFEVLTLDTPKKRRKKKSGAEKSAENDRNECTTTTIDDSDDGVELVEEILSLDSENSGERCKKTEELREKEASAKKGKKKKKSREANLQEAMEVTEAQNESAEGSGREKAKKKKKKTVSEESKENVDTENVAAALENSEESESARKKKKKRRKEKAGEEEDTVVVKLEKDETKTAEGEDFGAGAQSPWNSTVRKSKRSFKALFARAPVVNFVGSNINEIKGYGVDIK